MSSNLDLDQDLECQYLEIEDFEQNIKEEDEQLDKSKIDLQLNQNGDKAIGKNIDEKTKQITITDKKNSKKRKQDKDIDRKINKKLKQDKKVDELELVLNDPTDDKPP